MDGELGRILDLLEQHGAHEDTLTMFYSEQGISGPFAKWTLYDAGVRSSLVVRWNHRVPAGATSSALLQINDLLPTWIEAAGGVPAPEIEGRSMLDLLLEAGPVHRDVVYGIQTTTGIVANLGTLSRSDRSARALTTDLDLVPVNRFTNPHHQGQRRLLFSWRDLAKPTPTRGNCSSDTSTGPRSSS